MNFVSNPDCVISHFGPSVVGFVLLNQCERSFAAKIAGGLILADLGRRLYVSSQHNRVPGEGLSKKAVRVLGSAAGGALVLLGLYACATEIKNSSSVLGSALGSPLEEGKGLNDWEHHVPISSKGRNGVCNGEQVLEKLQTSAARPQSVTFEKPRLPTNLTGGVGTAQSLAFLNRSMQQCGGRSLGKDSWIKCLRNVVEPYMQGVSQELRDQQSVWHAIASKPGADPADRMQAMLNLYDLTIHKILSEEGRSPLPKEDSSSMKVMVAVLQKTRTLTQQSMEAFVLRGICPSEASRMGEWWVGHTAVLLRRENEVALFSPEKGLYIGTLNKRVYEAVVEILKASVKEARFSSIVVPTEYRAYQVR